jgi:hypothetical protein
MNCRAQNFVAYATKFCRFMERVSRCSAAGNLQVCCAIANTGGSSFRRPNASPLSLGGEGRGEGGRQLTSSLLSTTVTGSAPFVGRARSRLRVIGVLLRADFASPNYARTFRSMSLPLPYADCTRVQGFKAKTWVGRNPPFGVPTRLDAHIKAKNPSLPTFAPPAAKGCTPPKPGVWAASTSKNGRASGS